VLVDAERQVGATERAREDVELLERVDRRLGPAGAQLEHAEPASRAQPQEVAGAVGEDLGVVRARLSALPRMPAGRRAEGEVTAYGVLPEPLCQLGHLAVVVHARGSG
jgi:hypothetical protein